ncbi:response regulator transcription factor [Kocuria sp. JC486]|uniref:DNA-binding response regulator n=1 Tax=Kocuria soli TaxID=2485125 RepID=A0A3N4A182_9MICC|nr:MULTISPECIES: response regulator transcription factor [Kocuria]NHU85997.1 response regulator transcription factor [Kocuria sp. JC486]ROZ65834.1 DNA-binding response regulator [Kocuria soli]
MTGPSIVVVDDEPLVRQGICALLQASDELDVSSIEVAGNGEEALVVCAAVSPDIVLMDLRMPHLSGVEAIRELHAQDPHLPVLALTTFSTEDLVLEAMGAGASGYLVKDRAATDLVPAVQAVLEDGMPLSPEAARALTAWVVDHLPGRRAMTLDGVPRQGLDGPDRPRSDVLAAQLTDRELECLARLAEGMSNQEIATAMHVSVGAVKAYLGSSCTKLQVRDRVQLLIRATQMRLVTPALPE